MSEIGIQVRGDLAAMLKRIGADIHPTLVRGLLKAANYAGGAIAETIGEKFPHTGGEFPNSFLPARILVDKADEITAGALSDRVYARIQDEGGTITPKKRKNLAIPLNRSARPRWPRDWPKGELTLIRSKRGNMLLVSRSPNGKSIHPEYLLRPSVTIKGRGYIAAAKKKAEPVVQQLIDDELQAMINTHDKVK